MSYINSKRFLELLDKRAKSYEDGDRVDDNANEYENELQEELEWMLNWDSKLEDIEKQVESVIKKLKTHTHQEGTVYIKL